MDPAYAAYADPVGSPFYYADPESLDRAYKKLGFVPLDKFLAQRISENTMGDPQRIDGAKYQAIGASTWMLITACILFDGEIATTITSAQGQAHVQELREQFQEIHQGLYGDVVPQELDTRHSEILQRSNHPDNLCQVWFLPHTDVSRSLGTVFNDSEWKKRAVQRSMGPWGLIRHINITTHEGKPNRYTALDADKRFLLELTQEGVHQTSVDNRLHRDIQVWHSESKPEDVADKEYVDSLAQGPTKPKNKYDGKPPWAAAGWTPD